MPTSKGIDVQIRSPPLPLPSTEYSKEEAMKLNDALRLYFNQVDEQFRKTDLKSEVDAQSWFLG